MNTASSAYLLQKLADQIGEITITGGKPKAIWLGSKEWETLEQIHTFTTRMPEGTLTLWGLRLVSMEAGLYVEAE